MSRPLTTPSAAPPIDRDHALYLLHHMVRMRRSEAKCAERSEEGRPTVQPVQVTASAAAPGKRLRASPLARKLAAELGVDLSTV